MDLDQDMSGRPTNVFILYVLENARHDLKLVRMAVPLRDMESENLLDSLEVCLDFIDESRKTGSVLVHCFAGVSRRLN
ncbi:putative phosphoric monoester hydrolase [Helianthus annuus]|nr:putative phosphoric monoester hydrolase [Helianthus annuus]